MRAMVRMVPTAAAICALARQPELRAQMAQAARARVRARYRLTQVVASYERLYAGMAA